MTLKLFNTLTNKKEIFVPQKAGEVSFYVCGVTVYDYCHLGHARAYIVFDTIRRYLKHLGYKVKYVQNFTDIDDKIINRSNELNIPCKELTDKYIKAYFEDMARLNIELADEYPRATDYILQMQEMIAKLVEKGAAYVSGGDVWFAVDQFKDYGKLSKKVLDELQSGLRIDVSEDKRSPLDFVLWKAAKPNEPAWDSPWGKGRPGWHTECSVMATELLGQTIDIHGGGEDLVFPHHENEIAQAETISCKQFVRYWLHNGFVRINNEKMSKSLKNFFTIREVLEEYDGELLRFFLIKIHYRSPLVFTKDSLNETKKSYERLQTTLQNIAQNQQLITEELQAQFQEMEARFFAALDDDFNFSGAIGVLFDLNKIINTHKCGVEVLRKLGNVLGLFLSSVKVNDDEISAEITELLNQRNDAKKNKNFTLADELRNQLLAQGYKIEDTPEGARLKRV